MLKEKTKCVKSNTLLLVATLLCNSVSFIATANDTAILEKALTDNNPIIAEQAYKLLNKSYQNSIDGQVLYARLLFRQDKTEDSYDLLEQLSEDNKDNADIAYYFGRSSIVMAQKVSIFSKLSYASDALDAWKHALALHPNHIDTLSGLIGFHIGAPSIAGGDIEQALIYSKTLIDL